MQSTDQHGPFTHLEVHAVDARHRALENTGGVLAGDPVVDSLHLEIVVGDVDGDILVADAADLRGVQVINALARGPLDQVVCAMLVGEGGPVTVVAGNLGSGSTGTV